MSAPFQSTLGALPQPDGRTRFRVWAPDRRSVEVCLEAPGPERLHPLTPEGGGYFSATLPAPPGTRYRYRLDGRERFPDPASRWQPEGPHGPSEVVGPSAFRWSDAEWRGLSPEGQVLYELHVGTFTPEGTYAAAAEKLPHLKALGVTAVELLPLATCPGRFNWGYDGVCLFAPMPPYGTADALRAFVDRAHALGLGVLLDVVYNHLGPDGNYLAQYARAYFTDRYPGEWGQPLNFDGPDSGPVRDFVVQNACTWVSDFHLDGLRLDATQSLFDASPRHLIAELAAAVRAAAPGRRLLLVCESEPQDERGALPEAQGGWGTDLVWVDDFHHSARSAATGSRDAYLEDYRGSAQEFVSLCLRNALYQGQYYRHHDRPRGGRMGRVPPSAAVFYLQNHDQVANSLLGLRMHRLADPATVRALTAALLLSPQTPTLFMGQEFFASTPFHYFVDLPPQLQAAVQQGRAGFLAQFRTIQHALQEEGFSLDIGEGAFRASQLDWEDAVRQAPALALHTELLRLRREDPCFSARQAGGRPEAATLSSSAWVLRHRSPEGGQERLVLINLGADLWLDPCPEPLLAPPLSGAWTVLLSTEDVRFGGGGRVEPWRERRWEIPGRTALVLTSTRP